jgi:hypothetical protein
MNLSSDKTGHAEPPLQPYHRGVSIVAEEPRHTCELPTGFWLGYVHRPFGSPGFSSV